MPEELKQENAPKNKGGQERIPKKIFLEVTKSVHGLPCIEIQNPAPKVREAIRAAVLTQWMDDPAYKLKEGASPFLQGETEDWILVEFWKKDYQPFVDYLNKQLEKI